MYGCVAPVRVAGCLFPCECIEPRPRRLPKREYFALWSDQCGKCRPISATLGFDAHHNRLCTRADAHPHTHAFPGWLYTRRTSVTRADALSRFRECNHVRARARAEPPSMHGRKRAHACMHTQVRRHVAIHDTMSSCDSGRSQSLRRIHGLAAASAHSLTTSSHSRRAHR